MIIIITKLKELYIDFSMLHGQYSILCLGDEKVFSDLFYLAQNYIIFVVMQKY